VEYRNQLLNELEKITSLMNVPFARQKDYSWLISNVAINNENEKQVKKVITICQLLMKGE
jgi:hypothetical protein